MNRQLWNSLRLEITCNHTLSAKRSVWDGKWSSDSPTSASRISKTVGRWPRRRKSILKRLTDQIKYTVSTSWLLKDACSIASLIKWVRWASQAIYLWILRALIPSSLNSSRLSVACKTCLRVVLVKAAGTVTTKSIIRKSMLKASNTLRSMKPQVYLTV